MNTLYFWIALTIVFLLVEMMTATFYGLALALSSMIVGVYIFVSGDATNEVLHASIFVVGSAIFSYFLPKYLVSKTPDTPQGADRYTGEKRSVKKISGDLKISLDGVDYPILSDDEIAQGDKVEVTGHTGVSMKVKKIS